MSAARRRNDPHREDGAFVGAGRVELADLVGQPVRITWTDACAITTRWVSKKQLKKKKLPVMQTVALLVHVSDEAAHVAGDRDTTNEAYDSCGLIPLGWIRSVEKLS